MTKQQASLNILAVETSSNVLSVAIQAGNKKPYSASLTGAPRHSEQLLALIQKCLKARGLHKKELDEFVWGLGPGSFTGLRIGLSVLKGLQLGFQKRAYGASSLDVIALGTNIQNGRLGVCVDARRQRIYTAFYEFKAGKIKKVSKDAVLSIAQLRANLKGQMMLTGDALKRYGTDIQQKCGQQITYLPDELWHPKAMSLLKLRGLKQKWVSLLSIRQMIPRYLRVSEAEEKKREKV